MAMRWRNIDFWLKEITPDILLSRFLHRSARTPRPPNLFYRAAMREMPAVIDATIYQIHVYGFFHSRWFPAMPLPTIRSAHLAGLQRRESAVRGGDAESTRGDDGAAEARYGCRFQDKAAVDDVDSMAAPPTSCHAMPSACGAASTKLPEDIARRGALMSWQDTALDARA